jgi:hypothetical protein
LQGRFLFSSPTATSDGSKVDFTVDFARNFLYGSYDSSTAAFDTGLGIGLASVSIEQTGLRCETVVFFSFSFFVSQVPLHQK